MGIKYIVESFAAKYNKTKKGLGDDMRALVYGSLNYDDDYEMEHFVDPGETVAPVSYKMAMGGKGLNQAVSLAMAGMDTAMAGRIGVDGFSMKQYLDEKGVDTSYIAVDPAGRTGRAVIQIAGGENCIILFGGTNRQIDPGDVKKTISNFSEGDILLIQNEISELPLIMAEAKKQGMKIVFNVSPVSASIMELPLELCDILFVNEIEGAYLAGIKREDAAITAGRSMDTTVDKTFNKTAEADQTVINVPETTDSGKPMTPGEKTAYYNDKLAQCMAKYQREKLPDTKIVMTFGADGSCFIENGNIMKQQAFKMKPVDTTAAGDTFTGFFVETYYRTGSARDALLRGSLASSLSVMKPGASDSIPGKTEVDRAMSFVTGSFSTT